MTSQNEAMNELTHVSFVIEPGDETTPSRPGQPVSVVVHAELGHRDDEDVIAVADRVLVLDPALPAQPQVRELAGDELLAALAGEARQVGHDIEPDALWPHLQIMFSFGAEGLFPPE